MAEMARAEESGIAHPHCRVAAWTNVTLGEMKNFLGLLFLTAIVHKPEMAMHWSKNPVIATPYFPRTMARNRYQAIWRYLRFRDEENADRSDRLYRVRPLLDFLLERFQALFVPGEKVSIDEGMLEWRGRLCFRVYNPDKPIKYGIKSYILSDTETGYCYNLRPYSGVYHPVDQTGLGTNYSWTTITSRCHWLKHC